MHCAWNGGQPVSFLLRRNKFLSDLESSLCLVPVIKDPWTLQCLLESHCESIQKNPVYLTFPDHWQ